MAEFVVAAKRYWLEVFPHLERERCRWRWRAAQIPDSRLRELALTSQQTKAGSVEGAAAFAVFAQRQHRELVIGATTAYQTAFDYLDLLAEQPTADPLTNGRELHRALITAIDPAGRHIDYYAHHPQRADADYLHSLVDASRAALRALPSHALILDALRGASERIVAYQTYNHGDASGSHRPFEDWGQREARVYTAKHPSSELKWWELAAAAGSSMPVFALIAAATNSALAPVDVIELHDVYYPTVAALNSLLDSLTDQEEDAAPRQHRLLDYYESLYEALTRLQLMTADAMLAADALPRSSSHKLLLAAFIGFYLHPLRVTLAPHDANRILATIGALASPTMMVFRARDAAARVRRRH